MSADYRSGQPADNWPRRRHWNPDDLPGWYREMLGDLADTLTTWRDAAGHPHWFDPRCDPRGPQHAPERRAVR
jgi:hypothetical protein